MKEFDKCLLLIKKVRAVADGEEVAYVARSRIGRLLLSVSKLVARISKQQVPNIPQKQSILPNAPMAIQALVRICNDLNDSAKILVQPSEPLDVRWRAGWSDLMSGLTRLEHHIVAMMHEPAAFQDFIVSDRT